MKCLVGLSATTQTRPTRAVQETASTTVTWIMLVNRSVFAKLIDLKPGDEIDIYTSGYLTIWQVDEARYYGRPDASFLNGTAEPKVTLYTCGGTFDWASQSYSGWTVVTGRMISISQLGK